MIRKSRNKFEVDFLPPYGKPEVSIFGEAATYAGLAFVTGLILVEILKE